MSFRRQFEWRHQTNCTKLTEVANVNDAVIGSDRVERKWANYEQLEE